MTAPAFTPGPWFVGYGCDSAAVYYAPSHEISWNKKNAVARFDRSERGIADARLIAAAPDLYNALKLARKCIAYCRRNHADVQSGEGFPVEVLIDAALAKAVQP